MADQLVVEDIKKVVDNIFKEREEESMRKETELALNKSAEKITELQEALEAKAEEADNLSAELEEVKTSLSDLSDKNKELSENLEKTTSDLEAEKEELVKRAEAAEEELENMKKDQLAKARFEELKEAGVAATDDEAVEGQVGKIRDMTDEEFASYKSEREELRKSILAELESASPEEETPEEESAEEETPAEESAEEEIQAELEEEEVVNSEDSIEAESAMAALINMETKPGSEVANKYNAMGKAMVGMICKNKKSE